MGFICGVWACALCCGCGQSSHSSAIRACKSCHCTQSQLTQCLQVPVELENQYGCYHGKLTNVQEVEPLTGKTFGSWIIHADKENCNQVHIRFMMQNGEQATVTLEKNPDATNSNKAFKMALSSVISRHSQGIQMNAQQPSRRSRRVVRSTGG